jgi:diguanylate cyclase (GGDEF)-like protein/PAS domain S-box-containing protein
MVNPRFVTMLGYDSENELVGQRARKIYGQSSEYVRVGRSYGPLRKHGWSQLSDVHLVRRDGQEIVCEMVMSRARYQDQDVVIWTVEDVTDRYRMSNELEYQALHDPLTRIPNRRSLERELLAAMERAARQGRVVAIGVLDLDHFKSVNDIFGHETGDRVLKDLAERLMALLHPEDFLARLGGDEFVLILEQMDPNDVTRAIKDVLARLHQAVEQPFEGAAGPTLTLHMSFGLALYPQDGVDGTTLLRKADAALYQVKAHKHDRTQWWQFA